MDPIINHRQVWRPVVKLFGTLDAVRLSVEFALCTGLILRRSLTDNIDINLFLDDRIAINGNEFIISEQNPNDKFWLLVLRAITWVFLIVKLKFALLEVLFLSGLLSACEPTVDAWTAGSDARNWKYSKIAFSLYSLHGFLDILGEGSFGLKVLVLAKLILTVVGLYVVQMFIREQDWLAEFPVDENNNDLESDDGDE